MVTVQEKQDYINDILFPEDSSKGQRLENTLLKLLSEEFTLSISYDGTLVHAQIKKGSKCGVSDRRTIEEAILAATMDYHRGDISKVISRDFNSPEGFLKLLNKISKQSEVIINNTKEPSVSINGKFLSYAETPALALIDATYDMLIADEENKTLSTLSKNIKKIITKLINKRDGISIDNQKYEKLLDEFTIFMQSKKDLADTTVRYFRYDKPELSARWFSVYSTYADLLLELNELRRNYEKE